MLTMAIKQDCLSGYKWYMAGPHKREGGSWYKFPRTMKVSSAVRVHEDIRPYIRVGGDPKRSCIRDLVDGFI